MIRFFEVFDAPLPAIRASSAVRSSRRWIGLERFYNVEKVEIAR